jgi:DNA-binding SARP family transcriptional activator/LysM repeat protein
MSRAPAPFHLLATTASALLLAVRALFAAGVGAVILAALPYGLVRYIGWPLPHALPSLAQLKLDLTSPILDDTVYLNALAIVLWFLWLLLVLSFLVELAAVLRRVERPHLPALGPFQALAFVLLTAIGLTALMARTATPAQAAAFTTAPVRGPHSTACAPTRPGSAAETTADATPDPSPTDPAETVHVVVPGDTLYHIAQEDYDDANDWPILADLNEGVLQTDGQRLTDPNLILPGWRLITTDQPDTAPPATPSASSGTNTAPANRSSGVPATPTVPPPVHSSPTHTVAPDSATAVPTPANPAPTTTQTAVSRRPAPPERTHHADTVTAPLHWIDLTGGGALAATVLAALGLALARARRRRRWYANCYWPRPGDIQGAANLLMPTPLRPAPGRGPATGKTDDGLDEFGAPLETTETTPNDVNENEHAAQSDAVSGNDEHATAPTENDAPLSGEDVVRIPAAAAPHRVLTLQDLDPVLALTGPGALNAARAIAAAVLSSREHHPAGAQLLLARQDAAVLLEQPDNDLPECASRVTTLELAASPNQAIDTLEHHLAYRNNLLLERHLDNLEELSEQDLEYHPPLILLAVARADHTNRLIAALAAAAPLRVHAVLLGAHPDAPTWHVDADGTITGATAPSGTRAFGLSAEGLCATLALLARAVGHGEQPEAICAPDPDGELAAPGWEPDSTTTIQAAHRAEQDRERPQTRAQPREREPEHRTADHAAPPALAPTRPTPGPSLLTRATDTDEAGRIMQDYAQRPVHLHVLGVRAITTPTGSVDAGLRQDAWRLITHLAVHHRASHSAEDLAVLWPDHDDAAQRKSLRNALYDLRTTLKQRCGDTGSNPARYIQQRNHRYSINEQFIGIDLLAFTRLRSLAAATRNQAERASAAQAALDLYHGDLLAGQDEEWILAPRAAARRDALATATLLAQIADQNGEPEQALTWWERALQIDDNEEVYRQIIQLQARMGRRADAVATRDLLIARLDADQLSPTPETLAVLAQALNRRPSARSL